MATTTMRKTIKVVFLVAAIMGMVIALSSISISYDKPDEDSNEEVVKYEQQPLLLPSKRVSRFLAQTGGNYGPGWDVSARNPNAADHCHKDNEICNLPVFGKNATCCNNKCLDLSEDDKNCGACKNKCKYTQDCCRGQCVNLSYDKRHCGRCNNKCMTGGYCIYGMCDYA